MYRKIIRSTYIRNVKSYAVPTIEKQLRLCVAIKSADYLVIEAKF